ncbi:MAG: class I SAM-dependent methyltransferase [Phycisphaerae bacterium]|nr:class I SAM-dependent methyltransferase [Phycisphaerae bacterium]
MSASMTPPASGRASNGLINDWTDRPGATVRAWPSEQMIRLLSRCVPEARRRELIAMDIGAGTGRNSVGLAQLRFGRVIAVDPLADMLTATAAAGEAVGVGIETLRGHLPDLPCADASVDVAVCWGVLFSLGGAATTMAALDELARIIRPGGYLISDWRTDSDGLLRYSIGEICEDTHELGPDAPAELGGMVYSFWDDEQVIAFHEGAGFTPTAVQRHEIYDLQGDAGYSWWQIAARRD